MPPAVPPEKYCASRRLAHLAADEFHELNAGRNRELVEKKQNACFDLQSVSQQLHERLVAHIVPKKNVVAEGRRRARLGLGDRRMIDFGARIFKHRLLPRTRIIRRRAPASPPAVRSPEVSQVRTGGCTDP